MQEPLDEVIRIAEFRAAIRLFLRRSEVVARRHGLTPQRYLLLLMIKGAPDGSQRSTVTELTERLQPAQHTVTELVGRAEKAGLIRRDVSPTDARITYLRLSTSGEGKLNRAIASLRGDRAALRSMFGDSLRDTGSSKAT